MPRAKGQPVGIVPRHLPGSVKGSRVHSAVHVRFPGLTDIHEEMFSHRTDTIKAGLSGISRNAYVSAVKGIHGDQGSEHQSGSKYAIVFLRNGCSYPDFAE